jgi:shikimate kinase
MFLGGACARNAQEIADLFGEYFQGVYVSDNKEEDSVVDGGFEDSSTVLLIQLKEETVALNTQKGPGPDEISPLIRKQIVLVAFWGFAMRVEGVVRCPFVQEW